jgi:hypothetical protein
MRYQLLLIPDNSIKTIPLIYHHIPQPSTPFFPIPEINPPHRVDKNGGGGNLTGKEQGTLRRWKQTG